MEAISVLEFDLTHFLKYIICHAGNPGVSFPGTEVCVTERFISMEFYFIFELRLIFLKLNFQIMFETVTHEVPTDVIMGTTSGT